MECKEIIRTLTMQHLIDSYVEWLREEITIHDLKNGWYEIVTPFLNHKNDMIEIYVYQSKEGFFISDGGNTLSELRLNGIDVKKSSKRSLEIDYILRSFGIHKKGDYELFVNTTATNFPEVKHRFIQAILAIDDMFMIATPKVENLFMEDVSTFLEMNEVIFIKDSYFIGRSGFNHKFDFTIPKIKQRNETAIKVINTPRKDKIGNVLWMFQDTQSIRPYTNGLVIINDEQNLSSDIIQAFTEYNLSFFPWSQRSEGINLLRA